MPALDTLFFYPDPTPRGGPDQMALDEALLEMADVPVLRTYTWDGSWVSFGYSQSLALMTVSCPGQNLVRRWTGGGIVPHHPDWTFALIVPRDTDFARLRPTESYCQIHQAVARTLDLHAVPATLAADPAPGATEACFAGRPAQYDVLTATGAKLCGGAQRRTRQGFLHQGSVQSLDLPEHFGADLGQTLADNLENYRPSNDLLARARVLAEKKYATPEWTARIA